MATMTTRHLIMAPLRGFTDAVFRNAFQRHFQGIDEAVAPFVTSIKGRRIKPSHLRDLNPEENRAMPVVPQILSNNSAEFICLAKSLFDLGYTEINWNLGCPYPMVAKKMRGSGLLPHPEVVDRLLFEILGAIPGRLSIKTRLGLYSAAEMDRLIPVLNHHALVRVIIHPRIGVQMYTGHVDLDAFAACLSKIVHPVVYNGDIDQSDTFAQLEARFPGVGGWMLGRGLIANPLLPEMIQRQSTSIGNRFSRFKNFHDALVDGYSRLFCGPGHVLDRMKGFWRYWAEGFADGRRTLMRIRKVDSLQRYQLLVSAFFDDLTGKDA
jgi:tRNA-dihydrouridine synthase B